MEQPQAGLGQVGELGNPGRVARPGNDHHGRIADLYWLGVQLYPAPHLQVRYVLGMAEQGHVGRRAQVDLARQRSRGTENALNDQITPVLSFPDPFEGRKEALGQHLFLGAERVHHQVDRRGRTRQHNPPVDDDHDQQRHGQDAAHPATPIPVLNALNDPLSHTTPPIHPGRLPCSLRRVGRRSSPDVAGQVGQGPLVLGRVKHLYTRAGFHQLAHPQKDHMVGQAARLLQ